MTPSCPVKNGSGRDRQRFVRRALVFLMIAAGIVWILHTPYDPDAVWRAIPADAQYFSRHEYPAERLSAYISNPLTMTVFRSVGVEPQWLRDVTADPEALLWVERLFGRDMVLAYVPALGAGGEPAWAMASWIGNRSQRLRWQLSLRDVPGLHAVKLPGHKPFWRLAGVPLAEGRHLSLALRDGLLLGCVSADPVAVRYLVATWDRRPGHPSLLATSWREAAERLTAHRAPDRGAYALRTVAGSRDVPTSLFPFLQRLEPSYAAGGLIGSFRIAAAGRGSGAPPPLDVLNRVLGDAPVFWTMFTPAVLSSLTSQQYTPRWAATLAQALPPPPPGADAAVVNEPVPYPFFLAVLDDRFAGSIRDSSGRLAAVWIRGLTIPAVVAGLYVGDETHADTVFMSILDHLNREYRLGLIPRREPGETVAVIEETRSQASFYNRLMLRERVGAVYHEGWLLFAVQASVLERLIADGNRAGTLKTPPRRWMPAPDKVTALAYCWADMEAFGILAKDALAAVALMLLISDPGGSLEVRRRLADAQAWIDGLRTLEQGVVWLDSADTRFHLRFAMGEPAALP